MKYEVDIDRFWADDALAHRDNCFSPLAPQAALGIRMSNECVFAELGEPGNEWLDTPGERRIDLNRRYNDLAEKTVGIRLLQEDLPPEDSVFPAVRGIHEIFGGEYVVAGESRWLEAVAGTPAELEKVLDRAERIIRGDLRSFMLPEGWDETKRRIYEQYGKKPGLFRGIRGPVTLAMSLYGVENLIYLLYDRTELALRFRDLISDALMGMAGVMDAEAGYTPENRPSGFHFNDDNCCMLTPELYEIFGYPILKRAFETYSPAPDDTRFQHSDSAMGHLLPLLGRLDLTGCNFGPTVQVREIRKHLPHARIDGQLAPFTFMRNNPEEIIAEVRRDCDQIRESGARGLNIATAGSINGGSSLESMRVVMHAIQTYGRYE
ncbi:MAG: hypothetical protein GX592_09065 [Clostridiales bacterium]|nr:hypothetical protein [Clostridiales bacterium]